MGGWGETGGHEDKEDRARGGGKHPTHCGDGYPPSTVQRVAEVRERRRKVSRGGEGHRLRLLRSLLLLGPSIPNRHCRDDAHRAAVFAPEAHGEGTVLAARTVLPALAIGTQRWGRRR